RGQLTAGEASDGELAEDEALGSDLPRREELGVQLADSAREDYLASGGRAIAFRLPNTHKRGASRMKRVTVGRGRIVGDDESQTPAKELYETLGVVEIVEPRRPIPRRGGRLPNENEAEPPPLACPAPVLRVSLADLKD